MTSAAATFDCFGGQCSVEVDGAGRRGAPADAVAWARDQLLEWHGRFSRFIDTSELSRLNADGRATVPVSPLMVELAAAVAMAGLATDGIVDATLIAELEAAGYGRPLGEPERARGPRAPAGLSAGGRPAGASPRSDWASITYDRAAGTVTRPPGVQLDSGGLVKGLLGDVLAGWLGSHEDVFVDCCGDLAIGGTDPAPRLVEVEHPLSGQVVEVLNVDRGGIATSGTTRRSWTRADGTPGHHLLDPATGRPAHTGLIQVTALAPSALEAEVIAKWALLGGPAYAEQRLPHGGVVIDAAGAVHRVGAGAGRWSPAGATP